MFSLDFFFIPCITAGRLVLYWYNSLNHDWVIKRLWASLKFRCEPIVSVGTGFHIMCSSVLSLLGFGLQNYWKYNCPTANWRGCSCFIKWWKRFLVGMDSTWSLNEWVCLAINYVTFELFGCKELLVKWTMFCCDIFVCRVFMASHLLHFCLYLFLQTGSLVQHSSNVQFIANQCPHSYSGV